MKWPTALTFGALGISAVASAVAPPVTPAVPPYGLPTLARSDVNRLAAESGLPLFWRTDDGLDGVITPAEVAVPSLEGGTASTFVVKGAFTPAFEKAYRQLVEARRREAVRAELDQGRPTLVELDASAMSAEDQALLRHFQAIAALIDALYEFQNGATASLATIPKDDAASLALYHRNHGPWCEAAKTEEDPFCNATPTFAARHAESYPSDVSVDEAFCARLPSEPNGPSLIDPFTVVRRGKRGGYEAVPYTTVYGRWMKSIAAELHAAAKAITSEREAKLKAYLEATATAFQTNLWEPADEAWAAMSATADGRASSAWYVRVGPDETYWDPCGLKAGFHLSFARMDPAAEELKQKLSALRGQLEHRLSDLVGASVYAAREVGFNLPDFIDIVLNAGDSRSAIGATVGQSLPNFGKVASESRGRTVVMANLYTDPDSRALDRMKDGLLFSGRTLDARDDKGDAGRMTTIIHEATHNLGPNGSHLVGGKRPEEVFGGDLDAIFEELKAEVGAVYYLPFLKEKGVLTDDQVRGAYQAAISWGCGQISQGMFAGDKRPKTYSHVAAIQMNAFVEAGAVTWNAAEGVGTGDVGRLELDFDKLPLAIEVLMKEVVRIKAQGDKAAAAALDARATNEQALVAMHADTIRERILRSPKNTFVYAITFGAAGG